LVENVKAFLATIGRLKPATAKGQYVKSIAVSSTMGPGVHIDRNIVQGIVWITNSFTKNITHSLNSFFCRRCLRASEGLLTTYKKFKKKKRTMKKSEKEEIVAEVREKISRAKGMFFTDFSGITVEQATELRSEFRKLGVDYKVVKNTLARKALESVTGYDAVYKTLPVQPVLLSATTIP